MTTTAQVVQQLAMIVGVIYVVIAMHLQLAEDHDFPARYVWGSYLVGIGLLAMSVRALSTHPRTWTIMAFGVVVFGMLAAAGTIHLYHLHVFHDEARL